VILEREEFTRTKDSNKLKVTLGGKQTGNDQTSRKNDGRLHREKGRLLLFMKTAGKGEAKRELRGVL